MRIQLNRGRNRSGDCGTPIPVTASDSDAVSTRACDPVAPDTSGSLADTPPSGSIDNSVGDSDRISMHSGLVKAEELAKVLECTQQKIYALVRKGILPEPVERGMYHFVQSVTAYIRFLNSERNKDLKDEGHYKALNLKLESELRQMKIDTMKKNLLDADMVWEAWEKIGVAIKTKLQQFPTGYADQLSVMDEPKSIKATLEKAIDEILSELNHVEIKMKSIEDEP